VPQPFVGFSLRAFPSQRSRTPLEAASSPAVVHRPARAHPARLVTPGFTDIHAETRQPGFPSRYRLPFHGRSRFPVTLGSTSWNHPLQSASSTSKRCSLCESVRTNEGFPSPAADTLTNFRPFRAFSSYPWASRTRPTEAGHPLTREGKRTTRRTSRPPALGETSLTPESADSASRQHPAQCEPDRTASRRRAFSCDLSPPRRTSRASEALQ
jgi:hypothetical protein